MMTYHFKTIKYNFIATKYQYHGTQFKFQQQNREIFIFQRKGKSMAQPGADRTGTPTSEEAIKFAGLDYEVEKSPLFTKGAGIIENDNGIEMIDSALEVPNYFANIRTDNNTVLGVIGKDYHIVQNREAFSFFDSIVGGNNGILYETAGCSYHHAGGTAV